MPDDINPRLSLGANGGPPLVDPETLAVETEALRDRADKLIAASGRAAATDAETVGKCIDLVKMITEHAKRVEEDRKARKEPFLSAERTIDAYYKGVSEPLDAAKKAVTEKIDAYRKAAGGGQVRSEYGASAHAKKSYLAEVMQPRTFALWLLDNDFNQFMTTLTMEAARCIKEGKRPEGVTITETYKTAVR